MFLCVCDVSFARLDHFKRHNKQNGHISEEFFPFCDFKGLPNHHFGVKPAEIGSTLSLKLYLEDVDCPVPLLYKQTKRIAEILLNLTKDNQIRFFVSAKTSMNRPLALADPINHCYFRSDSDQILNMDHIEEKVTKMIKFVETLLQKYEAIGSGYKCHNTEYIALEIAFMKASVYGSRVVLPDIISPKSVLDLEDIPENQCFPYAFLASKHYKGRQKYLHDMTKVPDTSIEAYQGFHHMYKFPGNYPVNKDQVKNFCRSNNTRVCIFTYLPEIEDIATTCYIEAKKLEDTATKMRW
jgi:hypothetical protein